MQSVEVEIFGRLFRLRSDNPTVTKQLAAEISAQLTELNELYENLDFSRLLLLNSLQQQETMSRLTEENHQLKAELERFNQMIEKIISV
ncbi:MAG TPA: cell division protein ZapA [Candidatus Cloacimonadota bacterium]|nr:cell division protein ZapA [Candidatus Cloacimonadota bacterium]